MSALEVLALIVGHLESAGIPHMLTGSTAGAVHGEPRSTQDIDIVIDPSPANLVSFLQRLDRERFYVGDAMAALLHRDMFNVIDRSTGWKVDFIIVKDRPFSRSELDRRVAVDLAGLVVRVVTAEDLILAKLEWARAGGSERQRRDVAAILAVSGNGLDRAYLSHWAEVLGLSDDLAAVESSAPER